MPKLIRVTHTWDIEVPDDVEDYQDWARDYVLSLNPDTEDMEEING